MNDGITLKSPLELKPSLIIKNRFFKSAMSEQLGDDNHNPLPGLARVYRRWADGGVGLSISGNIMIDRTALGEPKNVVLDDESDLASFQKWTGAATANGTHFWAQLNHPGKQSPLFLSKTPVAPSAIPLGTGFDKTFNPPRALTESEIIGIIDRFGNCARLAKEVGFTGAQIHGAHGYLVSQFLSPRHNQRKDKWGGCIENRMRFVLEIYKSMRRQVGEDFPIGIKLNSADFMKGGFTENDSMQVVDALSKAGIDLIEISGGTYENPSMVGSGKNRDEADLKREAYFITYAEGVRRKISTPLVVTGGFRTAKGMQEALKSGATDMIGLARPLALDPDLANAASNDTDYRIDVAPVSTGIKYVDRMILLDITWYEQQIHRMSQGMEPKAGLSPWKTVWSSLSSMGVYAFKKRRA
ncbi:NADH:flavin oxidoreductase/NADH oxidase family protein [Sansalvadorimonas sp. 2012CJ34-2]|uniref:NADH:flavin oxidoreductase/NADH oxidase family protein n=1 Tax=Parendozoicomonas callyspongiae TaxID=2942213 RepID=A0ABT0PIZ6_9GAMM|nr:NADH:flavin oxidoreductase/NADH oxidase family protein [Sansalvadorimonas sp. 2012CJ34-2]MCL6271362.1 NADH:flavin oxidoreductase/NADH oxidase family protein [Sansalvadorimonas sp. 2012CJ34-2]